MKQTALFIVLAVSLLAHPIHAAGLPGEYLITQRWRDMLSPHSPLTNPALLTEEDYFTVRAAFAPTMQAAFKLWEMGVTLPLGLYQSAGVTWVGQNSGSYKGSYWDDNQQVSIDGGEISSQSHFFMLSYAVNPWRRLSLGLNLAMAYEKLFNEETRMSIPPGVDIGLSYRLARHPIFGNHVLGVSVQNLMAPELKSNTDKYDGDVYSRNLKLTWLSKYFENRIEQSIDVDVKDFLANKESFLDDAMSLEYDVYYRITGWILRIFKICGQFGVGDNGSKYFGFAGGANIPMVNAGKDLEILYQYNNMLEKEKILSHTIYARADFGKHREEIYARKLARMIDSSPNDLYNKALSLYHAGKHWDAFFVFGQILSLYPDFFKNDWVSYYLNSCQEELDMREAAEEGYDQMIQRYSGSEVVPYADLGMMRIAYRNNDNTKVEQQFSALQKPGVPDSLKYHAAYLMAETFMQQQDYDVALQIFEVIPIDHPDYPFAQHSAAIAHIMNNDTLSAVASFENSIMNGPQSKAAQEIIDRSYLMVGYLFYEKGQLSKTVSALRRVKPGSLHYEDALLGLGWSAIKSRQWTDCLNAARELQKASDKPVVQAEGVLLEAYALMMQKQYGNAQTILSSASAMIRSLEKPSEGSLSSMRRQYQNSRESYESVAQTARELTTSRQNETVIGMIDSLHTQQKRLKTEIDQFLSYSDNFTRQSFFARHIDQVQDDIEYALATATHLSGQKGAEESVRKQLKEQQKLDEEIERLKEEMEKLEE
ncbi:MAG: hypothetical protein GF401_11715 [Chitinivibrionales bacterium]|nr:hypothetical protein [Chitinivibrionales bacterium]